MKRIRLIILSVFFAFLCIFLFTGCNNYANDEERIYRIIGDWRYYWGEYWALYRVNINDTDQNMKITDSIGEINGVQQVLIDGDWVYYVNADEYKLYRVRTDGRYKMRLCEESCYILKFEGDWIYYQTNDHKYDYKIKKNGSEKALEKVYIEVVNSPVAADYFINEDGDFYEAEALGLTITDLAELSLEPDYKNLILYANGDYNYKESEKVWEGGYKLDEENMSIILISGSDNIPIIDKILVNAEYSRYTIKSEQ